jgi:hypothetical protein
MNTNRGSAVVLTTCVALAVLLHVGTAVSQTNPSDKSIVLVSVGPTGQKMMNRLSAFLAEEFNCKARLAEEQKSIKDSPEEEAKELSHFLNDRDVCLVALLNVPQETKFSNAIVTSARVALINIRYPDSAAPDSPESLERRCRRIEEDTVRAVAQLLGLSKCPLKLCALHYDQSTAKGDEVHSRGLCPPCQDKARKILAGAETPGSR